MDRQALDPAAAARRADQVATRLGAHSCLQDGHFRDGRPAVRLWHFPEEPIGAKTSAYSGIVLQISAKRDWCAAH